MIPKEKLEHYRKLYPNGTVVQLEEMLDRQAPPIGTRGTVKGVDDMGNLLMHWETGSSLNLIPEVDKFTVISKPE